MRKQAQKKQAPGGQLVQLLMNIPRLNRKQTHVWQNVYNIAYSQAVTHPSTNATQCCLTSVIGRELVLST